MSFFPPNEASSASSPREPSAWNPFAESRHMRVNEPEDEPYPIPNRATMDERWRFRDDLMEETADHRRIHPHSPGRSILKILYDRERRGARAITCRRRGLRKTSSGEKSPATVFESPNSTTSPVYEPKEEEEPDGKSYQLRRVNYPTTIAHEIRLFAEYSSTVRYHSAFLKHLGGDDTLNEEGQRPESSKAVSTISVAFSPDSLTMASTHGDHTVKISCCNTGRLLQSLDGHPRTPWTVKYHPTNSEVIASGCLGHQVRIWNWKEKQCLQMVRLDYAIISVSFHPSGNLLAIANGTRLHFWGMDPPSTLTEIDQRHMLRCVHFPPNGKSIIIGGVNPSNEDPRRRRGSGMSFYLRLWDFDMATALKPPAEIPPGIPTMRRAISNVSGSSELHYLSTMGPKRVCPYINQLLTFLAFALFYLNIAASYVCPSGALIQRWWIRCFTGRKDAVCLCRILVARGRG